MKNKKSVYVWIIIILTILGIIVFSLISGLAIFIGFKVGNLFSAPIIDVKKLIFALINLYLLIIYLPKLYNLKDDVIKWTNIIFTFSSINFLIQISFFSLFSIHVGNEYVISVIKQLVVIYTILVIIWITFVKHLKRFNNIYIIKSINSLIDNKNLENKKINKKKILISILIILIIIVSYLLIKQKPSGEIFSVNNDIETKVDNKYNPNGPYPSPLVDKANMINARGEVVDKWIKGTFKTIGENKTFEYKEKISPNYASTIDNCIKTNCKKTYFADDTYITYGSGAKFNDTDNPAVGKIAKIDFYSKGKKVLSYPTSHDMSDSVTYTILYSQNDKTGQTITYSEDLCVGTKGGGQYCHDPYYKIGAVAIFLNKEKKSSLTASQDSIFFTGEITEAELVSYQYYMTPDTGEVFPVVKR